MLAFLFGIVIFVFSTFFLSLGMKDILAKIGEKVVVECSDFFSEDIRHSFIFVLLGLLGYCVLYIGLAI